MKKEASKAGFILEIATVLLGSWWTIPAGLCLGLAGGLLAMKYLPKTYEATTKVLITPQQIPQEFVKSTVTDAMAARMAAIKESVLSRQYMTKLIAEIYGIPSSEREVDMLINRVKWNMGVDVSRYAVAAYSSNITMIVTLSFRDDDPKRAAEVVNTLTSLYIKENTEIRTVKAGENTKSMEQLAKGIGTQIDERDAEIRKFREQHLFEMPEQQSANLQMMAARQRDLEAVDKSIAAAEDRLRLLKDQREQVESLIGSGTASTAPDTLAARVVKAQRELADLRAKYSEDHPDVKRKKRELDDVMASATGAADPDGPGKGAPLVASPLDLQIKTQEAEIVRLQSDRERARKDIAEYTRRIEAAPRIQQQLTELMKGYDTLQASFNEYQRKAQSAQGAQAIEEEQKGEQFEWLEKALPPTIPKKPVPLIVYLAGIGAGLVLLIGPVVLSAVLRPVVLSEEVLESMTDIPVLVSITRIRTPQTDASARRRIFRNIALTSVAGAVLVAAVIFLR